jgi:hypothetical protein
MTDLKAELNTTVRASDAPPYLVVLTVARAETDEKVGEIWLTLVQALDLSATLVKLASDTAFRD